MPDPVPATATGLPSATFHDCLVMVLDATESRHGYTQAQREARSYMRAAKRQAEKLMEGRS